MIQLKNITKKYGKGKTAVTALENIQLEFPDHGMVVVLGKSGCGKSTLLNILGGLDSPTVGELVVNGKSTKRFSAAEYDAYRNTYVGMVFQEFNLIDEISVYDNIEITLKLQRQNTDVNSVDEVLKMVGLANLGYRKPGELSGGQRQRVSLARALLKKPDILLADEPTGALDSATGEEVFELLKRLSEKQLVVVVTHDRELAFTYGERIIELSDGKVISDRIVDAEKRLSVKAIGANVLEVLAGNTLVCDDINAKLNPDTVNFVGISHDKDRIALAYPETFDTFYRPKDKIVMRTTVKEDIVSDGQPFKMRKRALALKDTLKMARANRKRTKKRFWFIAVLNMFCFAIFAVSFMLSSVSMTEVIAKSLFDKHSQPVAAVSPMPNMLMEQREFSLSEAAQVQEMLGNKKAHSVFSLKLEPDYVSEGTSMFLPTTGNAKDMSDFTGVIEGRSILDLGLKTIPNGGKVSCSTLQEIIISDYSAQALINLGFFGQDRNGQFGLYYPQNPQDLIGMSLSFPNYDLFLTVAGIFKTDYARYDYLQLPEERLSEKATVQLRNLGNNADFLYTKMFAQEGFVQKNFIRPNQFVNATFYAMDTHAKGYSYELDTNKLGYKTNHFLSPAVAGKDSFLWVNPSLRIHMSRPDGTKQIMPNVQNDQMTVVSIEFVRNVFGEDIARRFYEGYADDLQNLNIITEVGGIQRYMRLAAVYEPEIYENVGEIYFHEQFVKDIQSDTKASLNSIMFNRGTRIGQAKKLASNFLEKDFLMFSSVGVMGELMQVRASFDTTARVFLYIALGIGFFSFLMMLNYMASSAQFRAKEIAVYRIVGASRRDVTKIFLTEGGILVLISFILSYALSLVVTYFLTLSYKYALQIFNLSFSIIAFNFTTFVVVLAAITGLVLLSSLLPIFVMTRKKALDALKIIE